MANANAPFGFKATRRIDGAAPNYAPDNYPIIYTNTVAIGRGDVVTLTGGYVNKAVTTDAPVLGILDGVEYYDTALKTKVWSPGWTAPTTALSGSISAKVITDTKQVFQVQASGANVAFTTVGMNYNFVTGAPNSLTQISIESLDSTTSSTTNTLPFRLVGLIGSPITDSTGTYNIVEVVLNDSSLNQLTGDA